MNKGIKGVREQLLAGGYVNHELQKQEKKVMKQKEIVVDDSDSEEEDRVWTAVSDSLSDVKGVISSLNDDEKDWSKSSADGKESNSNFHEWLDTIMKKYHKIQKDKDDEDLFQA